MLSAESKGYVRGYQASVLQSHSSRNATNSAAYLLPHIELAMHILGVGCGPGTITMDLAQFVPDGKVTGLECESAQEVVQQATASALQYNIPNVKFITGDVCNVFFFCPLVYIISQNLLPPLLLPRLVPRLMVILGTCTSF